MDFALIAKILCGIALATGIVSTIAYVYAVARDKALLRLCASNSIWVTGILP